MENVGQVFWRGIIRTVQDWLSTPVHSVQLRTYLPKVSKPVSAFVRVLLNQTRTWETGVNSDVYVLFYM